MLCCESSTLKFRQQTSAHLFRCSGAFLSDSLVCTGSTVVVICEVVVVGRDPHFCQGFQGFLPPHFCSYANLSSNRPIAIRNQASTLNRPSIMLKIIVPPVMENGLSSLTSSSSSLALHPQTSVCYSPAVAAAAAAAVVEESR